MLSAAKFSTLARNQSRALTLAPSTPHLSRPRRAPKPWLGEGAVCLRMAGGPFRVAGMSGDTGSGAEQGRGGVGRWAGLVDGGTVRRGAPGLRGTGWACRQRPPESSLAESAFLPGPGSWVSTRGTPAKSQRGSWKMTLRCVAAPGFSVNLHKTDGAGVPAGPRTELEFRNVRPEGP